MVPNSCLKMCHAPSEPESTEEDEPELEQMEIKGAAFLASEEYGEEQAKSGQCLPGLGHLVGREEWGQDDQERLSSEHERLRVQAMSKDHPLLILKHGEWRESENSAGLPDYSGGEPYPTPCGD
uniref:Uncharacterized protein n=2 Tax=Micrurus corallinus TaxID=54390 RepID=A0A2D4G4U8_MICCO